MSQSQSALSANSSIVEPIHMREVIQTLSRHRKALLGAPLVAGAIALGITFLVKPVFTAKTVFLPPQQQQSAAASALASLGGAISGLSGMTGSLKTPGDQYVSLMQSRNVEDRIIERFDLKKVYDETYLFKTRQQLKENVRIGLGKKDGLISVEVDATDPQMAANIANQYVNELRRLNEELALSEVQQRRVLFETEVKKTRTKLAEAQTALQNSGFTPEALKAEPKAAAEGYSKLRAEVTAEEVRLQALRRSLTDEAPEVQRQLAMLSTLRSELNKLGESSQPTNDANYLNRYRDFKYQEALLELFTKQYELARVDENREGALIQVVDAATKPEWKSSPKRAVITVTTAVAAFVLMIVGLLVRLAWTRMKLSAPLASASASASSDARAARL